MDEKGTVSSEQVVIDRFTGSLSISVAEAMQKIDNNSNRILFLLDDKGVLKACISDGDIRRWLLGGGNMTDLADRAANHDPKIAKNIFEAKKLYHRINTVVIPIVDDDGHVVGLYNGEGEGYRSIRNSINMPVVINAGGKGTRLDPFTRILPKPLIPVGDLPIIELIMKEYLSYNCSEFHIIGNYKRGLMKAYFAENEKNYNITWYDETEPLGTGGGLSLLKGRLKSTFFFTNCDILLSANYESMVKFHKDNNNSITMIACYKNVNIPYGVVDMGINGSFDGIKEKPLLSFLTNTGMYIVEPDVVEDMEDGVSIDFPDVLEKQRKKGNKVGVFPIGENDWMDMGQLEELEKMREKLYGE